MHIRTSGVFLSGEKGTVWEEGTKVERFIGKFHDPESKDNALFLAVFKDEDAETLEQYHRYELTGHLNSWASKSGNVSHKILVDRLDEVTA